MAAEQRVGRTCHNGCGRSIEHLRIDSKWCAWCKVVLEKARKAAMKNRRKTPTVKSPHVQRHLVVNQGGHLAERSRAQSPCKVCCGMPWARVTNRYTEGRYDEDPVSLDGVKCRGCSEPYAPEPAPKAEAVLRSSAGTTVRAAPMYAVSYEIGKGRPEKNGSK